MQFIQLLKCLFRINSRKCVSESAWTLIVRIFIQSCDILVTCSSGDLLKWWLAQVVTCSSDHLLQVVSDWAVWQSLWKEGVDWNQISRMGSTDRQLVYLHRLFEVILLCIMISEFIQNFWNRRWLKSILWWYFQR